MITVFVSRIKYDIFRYFSIEKIHFVLLDYCKILIKTHIP